MARELKSSVVLLMMAVAMVMLVTAYDIDDPTPPQQYPAPSPPPPPPHHHRHTRKHLLCSMKCAERCHVPSRRLPLCMSKCMLRCLANLPNSVEVSNCTLDCANSTISAHFHDEKQLENEEVLQEVGDLVAICCETCKQKNMI
ncbi:uncharacterized protein LOC126683303 [Mercurialis annua]|uniref:uncharacterized protein LOC126683303 n=1 Tax=Mercurialis annua TaxID=3986 RepID=UPI00216010DD|nr:uncharacterized protein LOC126683303 [Mercurialis annua]